MSPTRARRPCAHPGCPTLVVRGRCPEHEKQRQRQADTKTPEERRFYSSTRWKRFRAWYLAHHPLCVECQREGHATPATVADHIIPRRQGGTDCDESNTQALCQRHHNAKRQQERGG